MKIKITHDVFNITNRLKHIDKDYFVLFNTKIQKYEVHNSCFANTYCLTLPFNSLDSRAIDYVLKSQKVDEMIEEIESNNLKIEKSNNQIIEDRVKYQLKEIYDYSSKKVVGVDADAYKYKWC